MDGSSFDHLSRRFARLGSRRQALKAMAGAVAGVVAGSRVAAAQDCTPHYSPCSGDPDCCAGSVCEYGLCMPGCRIDGTFASAWTSPPDNICAQCLPETSTTSWSPANEGMSCWSGDPTAGPTVCQGGTCRPTGPATCPPPPPCHTDELIDPATCTYAVAEAGTVCGGQAMCHGEFFTPADTCDGNGVCIGGGSQTVPCAPYVCGTGACTTGCETDDDCASGAHCDAGQCSPDADLGQPCDEDSDCQSGLCVNGVCCNQRCEGSCETCSAETGGHCEPVTGGCRIDGVCYPTGANNAASPCLVCDPETDPTAWSLLSCSDGAVCMNGACIASLTGEVTAESDYHGICATLNGHLWPTAPSTFTHAGGSLEIGAWGEDSGGGTLFNTRVELYPVYDAPGCVQCCDSLIASNFDGGCGFDGHLVLDDLAPGTYTAVVSGATVTTFGTFTLTFGQGPAC